jgi:hypothetical protein
MRGRLDYGEPSCIAFGGLRVDDAVEAACSPSCSLRRSRRQRRPRRKLHRDVMKLKKRWSAPTTEARLKKRIVRTVIQEALADLDDITSEIVIVIHWAGGAHTEHRLPRRRRGQSNATPADIVAAVRALALIAKDDVIASILNRNGLKTGNGNRWTRERVTSMRSHYRIQVYRPAEDGVEAWLDLTNAASVVGVSPKTLRLAAERGDIDAMHPLEHGPWLFRRADLEGAAAQRIILPTRGSANARQDDVLHKKISRINNIERCSASRGPSPATS